MDDNSPRPLDCVPGTDVGQGYLLKRFLGKGAFGQVWEATAPGDVPCAVKIVSWPNHQAQSESERQALELIKRLNHPCLLTPLGFWTWRDRLVIATILADGSLGDRLRACPGGIPRDELVQYVRDAAEGLDCLHKQRLKHRDVKPANLLYRGRHALVGDCGLVRFQPDSLGLASKSEAGTPAYMAPEAWAREATFASDQYSLALTYAELRLGHRLQTRGSTDPWLFAIGDPDLSEFAPAEARALARALDLNHRKRFPSCGEFVRALEQAAKAKAAKAGLVSSFLGVFARKAPEPRADSGDATQTQPGPERRPAGPRPEEPPAPARQYDDDYCKSMRGTMHGRDGETPVLDLPGAAPPAGPPTRTHPPGAGTQAPHGGATDPALEGGSTGGLKATRIEGISTGRRGQGAGKKAKPSAARRAFEYALLAAALGLLVGLCAFAVQSIIRTPPPSSAGAAGSTEKGVSSERPPRPSLAEEIKALIDAGDFAAALRKWDGGADGQFKDNEKQALRDKLRGAWLHRVEELGPDQSAKALALLDEFLKAPPFRDDPEGVALREKLIFRAVEPPRQDVAANPATVWLSSLLAAFALGLVAAAVILRIRAGTVWRPRETDSPTIVCSECGTSLSHEQAKNRLARGNDSIRCNVCDSHIPLPGAASTWVGRRSPAPETIWVQGAADTVVEFDPFLSHNSKDKSHIKIIYQILKDHGLKPWLDEKDIRPGTHFRDAIQQAIPASRSALVFLGVIGVSEFQADEIRVIHSTLVLAHRPVIPVLLPGMKEIPKEFPFLKELQCVRFVKSMDEPEAIAQLVWGLTGRRPEADLGKPTQPAPATLGAGGRGGGGAGPI